MFIGHLNLYNKNQIREKLLLVLIFYASHNLLKQVKVCDERTLYFITGKIDIGLEQGGAYGDGFFILHNGLQRKLL